jgi:hypothetical protein
MAKVVQEDLSKLLIKSISDKSIDVKEADISQ